MSLTKLFNKNYFVQNILKSKAVMALVIGIIPILNAILLMAMASNESKIIVADLTVISVLNIIGMYIIPIVLSLCLFGYVFKRKSVDFINSMPLTRKTIYITNGIGGILLIIVMMLINALLLCVESLIFTNLIIPFSMILDYFIVWTISYIFVFTVANIATSISGNHITMLVVTAIILFLVPFMHNYITGFNGNLYGSPYYVVDTVIEEKTDYTKPYTSIHVEKIQKDVDYTLPYNYISSIFKGNVTTYSLESIVKMLILSVIYFVLGMYLFEKRKMEVNETSFKSNNLHMIVKSLTLVPIGAMAMLLITETSSLMAQIFILVLIIAYYLIYDLITTKTIRNIKLGAIYFVVMALISVGLHYGVEKLNNETNKNSMFKVEDISEVAFYIDEIDYSQRYLESKMTNVYLDNEELLKIVKENINNVRSYKDYSMDVYLKLSNNKEYKTNIYLELEEYNKIVNIVLSNEEYIKEYKNIDYSEVQAISVEDITLVGEEMKEALIKIKTAIDNANLKDVYKIADPYITVDLELYKDHRNIIYNIPLNISEQLLKEYANLSNKKVKSLVEKNINIYNVRLLNYNKEEESFYENIYESDLREYLLSFMKNNIDTNIDVTKPMIMMSAIVEIGRDEHVEITYFTNNVLEFIQGANNIIGGGIDE